MKKFFLLLAAACLLCCVSCKDKKQSEPAQESKNSPAYDAAMKVLDKAEKELNKAKTCEDLKRIEDYLDEEDSKLTEKYGEDKNFTKKEREKIEDRGGSLYKKLSEKAEALGCGGGYDDSYGYDEDFGDYDDLGDIENVDFNDDFENDDFDDDDDI